MSNPPPLTGLRVLEFAGLAPGPFAGLLLADYGATVLRVDRPISSSASTSYVPPDQLVRRKKSIAIDLKSPTGIALLRALIPHVDVVIDPFRPGVLEKLGLGPTEVMLASNPRVIVARMTGFRRDGKYKDMAGHDINYIAVSGVLSMLGRKGEKPYAPGNIIGDFAGGGAVCFMGILLALLARNLTGRGQVVEANMVDGSAMMATFPRLALTGPAWCRERGENLLDGGSPFYDTYETKDGKYMAVGAIEPQFFTALLKGLEIPALSLPGPREDPATWPALRALFTQAFKRRSRAEWEAVFDGTDACCTPVLDHAELEEGGYEQRPLVTLRDTPGLAISKKSEERAAAGAGATRGQGEGVSGEGWDENGLVPGTGGVKVLEDWAGWQSGKQFESVEGGLTWKDSSKL